MKRKDLMPLMFVYIWSGQWEMFWRPGAHGYTPHKTEAGIWPHSEAVRWTTKSYEDKRIKLIPVAPEYEI